MSALDWRSLVNDDSISTDDLASNIRYIFGLAQTKSSEIPDFKQADYTELANAARRTLDSKLLEILKENRCNDSDFVLKLIKFYITNVDDLAYLLTHEKTIDGISSTLLLRLKSKLECRGKLLELGFRNENNVLDEITTKFSTLTSFQSMTYEQLNNYCRKIDHVDHVEILKELWMKDNDLRKKIRKYNLPFEIIDQFRKFDISTVNDLTEHTIQLIISEISPQTTDKDDKSRINRLKANLKHLYQGESDKGKEKTSQQETIVTQQRNQTDEAILLATKSLKNLKDNLSSGSTNVQADIKLISDKLGIPEWKLSENDLKEPVEVLNQIIDELNSVKTLDLKSEEYSDEELITHISGGAALYGISFIDPTRLNEKAARPLLRKPECCPLNFPDLPFNMVYHKFTSIDANNQFEKIVKTCGYTVAANLSISRWGFHMGKGLNQVTNNSVEQYNQTVEISKEVFLTYYLFVPTKSFRIPIEEMRLSNEAEHSAHSINNLTLAKKFLNDFNSHVSTGIHHLGGIHMCTISVTTDSLSSVDKLEEIGVNHFNTTIGAGFQKLNIGGSISYESFDDSGKHSQTAHEQKRAQIKTHISCFGPPCTNRDLFHQLLHTHSSTWYIIDRSDLKSLVPVWELMKDHVDPCIREAAKFVKRAWLEQAMKYSHIPVIECEIERVMLDTWSPSMVQINLPFQLFNSKQGKPMSDDAVITLENTLEEQVLSLPINDNISGEEMAKRIRIICHIIYNYNLTIGLNLLPAILLRDKTKSFLHTVAIYCLNDVEKKHVVLSSLKHLLSNETISRLRENDIYLDGNIINLLQDLQQFREKKEAEKFDFDHLSIHKSVTMLNDLPTKLKNMQAENTENDRILVQNMVQIIKMSLIKGESVQQQQLDVSKQIENMLTNQHGWTNDGFIVETLTPDGIKAVIKDIEDKLNDIQNVLTTVITQQTEVQRSNSNYTSTLCPTISTTNNSITEEKYSHLDWIIDRPVIDLQTDPVTGFIDRLRHRMKLDIIPPKTFSAISSADEDQQLLDEWMRDTLTNRAETEQQCTDTDKDQIYYDIDNGTDQLNSLTDVLVYLTNNSKLTSKIELFRLLLERRYAVPIITPNVNQNHKQPFRYHADVLKFIPLSSVDSKISYLIDNRKLYRIAIISRQSIEQSETSHLISTVFGSHSTHELQRSENAKLTMGEIAEGYIDGENDKKWPFLLLHIVGDYNKLLSFISEFANLIIIEHDSKMEPTSQVFVKAGFHIPTIIWNVSETNAKPSKNENKQYVLTGTINGILKYLQIACVKRMEAFKDNDNSLDTINDAELFHRPILNMISVVDVTLRQDYSTLRHKLLLQESFNVESKYRVQLNRLKNDYSEQRSLEHKIQEQEQNRQSKKNEIEKLEIIECFTNVLRHPNFDQRIIAINELINGIDNYSGSAIQKVRRERDEAFHEYQQAVRQKHDGDLLKSKFIDAKANYVSTLVSVDHLWRECSQLYASDPVRYSFYPAVAAQHLIDGFPLELLDGDAGMICDKWIYAVLKALNTKLQDKTKKKVIKIFVLSILGVQSSGKSTLLNIMFGVRFRSSAGQCTRGVNIQLIKVEDRSEYDYILLMDTEGLRAPELKDLEQAVWKDNRLATFTVLPADATIILVNGEQDETLKDVLPIVMSAYQQSQIAENYGNQLASMIFFVYCRVDVKQIDHLIPNVQELIRSLTTSFQLLQSTNLNENSSNEYTLFRDFRLDMNNENSGDIRFFGNIKNKDGTLDTDYGIAVTRLREYIHNRVTTSQTTLGWKWNARTLEEFTSFIGTVWKCIISSDFNLTFSSAIERKAYDQLDTLFAETTHNYASTYNLAYEKIEKEIIKDTQTPYPVKQNSSDHDKEVFVREKIDLYFDKLNTLISEELRTVNTEFTKSLDDPRWQKWKILRLELWKQFKRKQVDHWKDIISEKLHSTYLFDMIVNQYQRCLRNQIKDYFQNSDKHILQSSDQNDLDKLFNTLFDNILSEAHEKHQPIRIEQVVTNVYKLNAAGIRWNLKRNCMDLKAYAELSSKTSRSAFLKRKVLNMVSMSTKQEKELELLNELLFEIHEQLETAKCYSDHIVQDAIRRTTKKLKESKYHSDKLEEKAHNLIYDLLTKRLTEIQNNWNESNNIVVRLESERERMYDFFLNASKGIAGTQLFISEIKNILKENLVDAYKEIVIKHIVSILQNERFVKSGKVIQAHADLHLIKLIKEGDIDKLFKILKKSAKHYEFILNQLIIKKLVDSFQSQWPLFVRNLKLGISLAAAGTQRNKKDRKILFITELIQHLPAYLAQRIISLDPTIFNACDDENETFLNEIEHNILQYIGEFEQPVFEIEQITDIIKSIRSVMTDRQHNISVKLRCGVSCPCCEAPCHLDAGHISSSKELTFNFVLKAIQKSKETKHDTYHQPQGLLGTHCGEDSIQANEIAAPSCSMSVRHGNRFWYNDKLNEYKNFNKVFPEWSLPLYDDDHRLKLREYIFYHYHKELANYHGRLPCTAIPAEYNHDLNTIEEELLCIVGEK